MHPSTVIMVLYFNIPWETLLRQTKTSQPNPNMTTHYFIPVFHGHHESGHWFLLVLLVGLTTTKIFIIDTLDSSKGKTTLVRNFISFLTIQDAIWTTILCVQQCKFEWGPRTIVHIHDLVDQINDGVTIKTATRNLNQYTISSKDYATHARRWLRDLTYNDDMDLSNYNITPQSERRRARLTPLHTPTTTPNILPIPPPKRTDQQSIHSTASLPMLPTQTSKHQPLVTIEQIITHYIDHETNLTTFFSPRNMSLAT